MKFKIKYEHRLGAGSLGHNVNKVMARPGNKSMYSPESYLVPQLIRSLQLGGLPKV